MSYARSLQDIRRPPMSKVAEARAKLEAGTLENRVSIDGAVDKLLDLGLLVKASALPPAEFRPVEHTPWDADDYDSNGQA